MPVALDYGEAREQRGREQGRGHLADAPAELELPRLAQDHGRGEVARLGSAGPHAAVERQHVARLEHGPVQRPRRDLDVVGAGGQAADQGGGERPEGHRERILRLRAAGSLADRGDAEDRDGNGSAAERPEAPGAPEGRPRCGRPASSGCGCVHAARLHVRFAGDAPGCSRGAPPGRRILSELVEHPRPRRTVSRTGPK